jgi:hypothetical protein
MRSTVHRKLQACSLYTKGKAAKVVFHKLSGCFRSLVAGSEDPRRGFCVEQHSLLG